MHPEWWRETELDPERERHHDRAEHQDDTDDCAITDVMRTEVEIADGAAIADVQQASEQFTLPAARTTTGQRDVQQ